MERRKAAEEVAESIRGMAAPPQESSVESFCSSGSTLLNLALTNHPDRAWPFGRVVNIVGDKSSGKTLLCIEAIAYALRVLGKTAKVRAVYNETESAFDKGLAATYGMPVDEVEFRQSSTVEEMYNDIDSELDRDDYDYLIYITDSLDALSSREEIESDISKGSYGASKPKKMSEIFRRMVRKVESKNALVVIVSQIRDKIGVVFGESKTRSGGKALDFYASQIVWLSEKDKIKRANRIIGIEIKAKIKKNKVWKPFREVDFSMLFEYGVDDISSMLDFCKEYKKITISGGRWKLNEGGKNLFKEDLIQHIEESPNDFEYLKTLTLSAWQEAEQAAQVKRKPKYDNL